MILELQINRERLTRHRASVLAANERVAKEGPRIGFSNITGHELDVEIQQFESKTTPTSTRICRGLVPQNETVSFLPKNRSVFTLKHIAMVVRVGGLSASSWLDETDITKAGEIVIEITDTRIPANIPMVPILPDARNRPISGETDGSKAEPGAHPKRDRQSEDDKVAEEQRRRQNDENVQEWSRKMIELRRQQQKSMMDSLEYGRKMFNDAERYRFDQFRERRLP